MNMQKVKRKRDNEFEQNIRGNGIKRRRESDDSL